jgi:gluconokinase
VDTIVLRVTHPSLVVMGVSAAGKSELARALATVLNGEFLDADDFHPSSNRDKLSRGVPLTDADRAPWLDALAARLRQSEHTVVLACSALRRTYRDVLRNGSPNVQFVHLAVDAATLAARLHARQGHFVSPSLLESQLRTLEPPSLDENALTLDGTRPPDELVAAVLTWMSTAS